MTHLEHHLYQVIFHICSRFDKCTCSRETLCKMLSLSPSSKRCIGDAVQTLESLGLIEVERVEGDGWTITMANLHETTYDQILWQDVNGVIDYNQYEREFGEPKPIKMGPSPQDDEITKAFKDEDFQF